MEIITHLGHPGRMIGGSKSGYMSSHPNHLVVFNSNLFLESGDGTCTKEWYGDIDISIDREKLIAIAVESGMTVTILREMDGRFERENNPALDEFVYKVTPAGEEKIGGIMSTYFSIENGNIKRKRK
jgi:hypothetical protein